MYLCPAMSRIVWFLASLFFALVLLFAIFGMLCLGYSIVIDCILK